MKKVISVFLSLLLTLGLALSVSASDFQKTKVIVEKTSIYEAASVKTAVIARAKKDWSFTPVGSTKSFWKIKFKKKNDDTVYDGYVLKADTDQLTSETTNKASSYNSNEPPKFTDWVPYSTSCPKTLAEDLANGNVVYYNGQYWASPEYATMLANEVVVRNNISKDASPIDRYAPSR